MISQLDLRLVLQILVFMEDIFVKKTNDFRRIHHKMYGDIMTKQPFLLKMICSEFVARSVVSALYETNKNLQEKFAEEKLTSIIRVPLGKEHLNKIHPERLINLLYKEKCLECVNRSSFLQELNKL